MTVKYNSVVFNCTQTCMVNTATDSWLQLIQLPPWLKQMRRFNCFFRLTWSISQFHTEDPRSYLTPHYSSTINFNCMTKRICKKKKIWKQAIGNSLNSAILLALRLLSLNDTRCIIFTLWVLNYFNSSVHSHAEKNTMLLSKRMLKVVSATVFFVYFVICVADSASESLEKSDGPAKLMYPRVCISVLYVLVS